jgi:hypothetical protein
MEMVLDHGVEILFMGKDLRMTNQIKRKTRTQTSSENKSKEKESSNQMSSSGIVILEGDEVTEVTGEAERRGDEPND